VGRGKQDTGLEGRKCYLKAPLIGASGRAMVTDLNTCRLESKDEGALRGPF